MMASVSQHDAPHLVLQHGSLSQGLRKLAYQAWRLFVKPTSSEKLWP